MPSSYSWKAMMSSEDLVFNPSRAYALLRRQMEGIAIRIGRAVLEEIDLDRPAAFVVIKDEIFHPCDMLHGVRVRLDIHALQELSDVDDIRVVDYRAADFEPEPLMAKEEPKPTIGKRIRKWFDRAFPEVVYDGPRG